VCSRVTQNVRAVGTEAGAIDAPLADSPITDGLRADPASIAVTASIKTAMGSIRRAPRMISRTTRKDIGAGGTFTADLTYGP